MQPAKNAALKLHRRCLLSLLISGMLILEATPRLSQKRPKPEALEATALGTSTKMGQVIGVTVTIYEYSTPEDRQILLQAFEKGKIRVWSTLRPR